MFGEPKPDGEPPKEKRKIRTLYEDLGVLETATEEEMKSAHRKNAQNLHSDKIENLLNPLQLKFFHDQLAQAGQLGQVLDLDKALKFFPEAEREQIVVKHDAMEEKFKKSKTAYDLLKIGFKRKLYDEIGRQEPFQTGEVTEAQRREIALEETEPTDVSMEEISPEQLKTWVLEKTHKRLVADTEQAAREAEVVQERKRTEEKKRRLTSAQEAMEEESIKRFDELRRQEELRNPRVTSNNSPTQSAPDPKAHAAEMEAMYKKLKTELQLEREKFEEEKETKAAEKEAKLAKDAAERNAEKIAAEETRRKEDIEFEKHEAAAEVAAENTRKAEVEVEAQRQTQKDEAQQKDAKRLAGEAYVRDREVRRKQAESRHQAVLERQADEARLKKAQDALKASEAAEKQERIKIDPEFAAAQKKAFSEWFGPWERGFPQKLTDVLDNNKDVAAFLKTRKDELEDRLPMLPEDYQKKLLEGVLGFGGILKRQTQEKRIGFSHWWKPWLKEFLEERDRLSASNKKGELAAFVQTKQAELKEKLILIPENQWAPHKNLICD